MSNNQEIIKNMYAAETDRRLSVNSGQSENSDKNEKETFGRKQKIKEIVVEWASGTTPHGLSNIFINENYFLKSIWLVCLFASIAYCLEQMVVTLETYYSYKVQTDLSIVDEAPTLFPAVFIENAL